MGLAFGHGSIMRKQGDRVGSIIFEIRALEKPVVVDARIPVRRQAHDLVLIEPHPKPKVKGEYTV